MSLGERFFALMYDRMIAGAEEAGIAERRQELLAGLGGDVLEVGVGTGANLPYYNGSLHSLTLTEPSKPMLRRLQPRVDGVVAAARLLRAPAEDLPFEDESFDTVVCTLVLCGVDDQPRALGELRRVLRPGGKLLFLEHVRSEDPKLARLQDRMNPINNLIARCDCNRPTVASIGAAGFTVAELERGEFPKAPKWVRPLVVGTARA
jgi:ubiquinone/menaquinone biosynthesis C-methylase UbiE